MGKYGKFSHFSKPKLFSKCSSNADFYSLPQPNYARRNLFQASAGEEKALTFFWFEISRRTGSCRSLTEKKYVFMNGHIKLLI